MRFLLKVVMDAEASNKLAKAGKLATTIQSILADLKPEAAYFTPTDGQRSAYLFFEMQDASRIPAIVTPWFQALKANVTIHPVMVPADLAKAATDAEAAAKKYG